MLTRDQVISNINAMEKQGAKPDEIQGWLDTLPKQTTTPTPAPKDTRALGGMAADFVSRVDTDLGNRSKNIAEDIMRPSKVAAQGGGIGKTALAVGEAGLRTAGDVAGGIFDFGMDIAKTLTPQPLKNILKAGAGAIGKEIMRIPGAQQAAGAAQSFQATHPEISKDIGAATDIASLVVGPKAAEAGAVASGKAAEVAGEAAAESGRAVSGTGRVLFNHAITPNTAEAERILKYEAKVPFLERVGNTLKGETSPLKPTLRSDTALEKGLFGRQKDIGVQATRQAENLWNTTISPAVKESDATISKQDLFAPIEARIASTAEPGRKAALQRAYEAIQEDYKDINAFSLEQGQAIKRGLDEFTPEKMFRGQNVASEYKTLAHDMAGAIRNKTYSALKDKNIRKAYLDYGNLAELEKVGVKAISEAGTKGGFGGFWSTMWDAATTPIKTVGGQVLYRVGNKLEFIGEKGIKKFGQFLQGKGFTIPK